MLCSGADGFVAKPFDLDDLLVRTASYLQLSRLPQIICPLTSINTPQMRQTQCIST
jgi:DNA-binding response OmpR family regulator